MEKIALAWDYLNAHKTLYCLLLPVFIWLFFLTADRPHMGNLKSSNFSYSGLIYKDMPYQSGTLTYKNGDSYSGGFNNGKYNGYGTFQSKSGKWNYAGTFKNGEITGNGTMTTPDGKKHSGKFVEGMLQSTGGQGQ